MVRSQLLQGDGGESSHWRNALVLAEMAEDRRHCRPQEGLEATQGDACEGGRDRAAVRNGNWYEVPVGTTLRMWISVV